MTYTLIMGNRVYSSWSLRTWLMFRAFDIAFEHQVVPLYTPEFERFREDHFPARQVPTLVMSDGAERTLLWDSLSITEFLHERHRAANIWPSDPSARATARSLCAEMHSGFKALRSTMPMNLKRRYRRFVPDADTRADIERIVGLWRWASSNWSGGPYLFGRSFTAADAFFSPVASRFRTYAVALDEQSQSYADMLLSHPSTKEFYVDAQTETWVMEHNEFEHFV